jgi:hypothetical protein
MKPAPGNTRVSIQCNIEVGISRNSCQKDHILLYVLYMFILGHLSAGRDLKIFSFCNNVIRWAEVLTKFFGTCTNPRPTNPRTTIPNGTIPRMTIPRCDNS